MTTANSAPAASRHFILLVCFVATLGGLLFGYDTGVISGAIGYLQQKFQLTPFQVGFVSGCILIGCMVGVALAGPVGHWLGRKKLLLLSAVLFGVSSVGTAWPEPFAGLWGRAANPPMEGLMWLSATLFRVPTAEIMISPELAAFVLFRILAGVGVGVASIASPMYIAEIAPPARRGQLISFYQLAIVTGIFVVYFVNWYISNAHDAAWNINTGWRWMFASCAFPSLVFLALLVFVPESPRWLVEKRRAEEARAILTKVNGPEIAAAELVAIQEAISHEAGSLRQLLRPGWRAALVIGIVLAVLQQVTGINAFIYFGPEIFKKLGSEANAALLQHVTLGAVNLIFTLVAIYTVDRWGRKPLMLWGTVGMCLCLFAMAAAALTGHTDVWILLFILGYLACFAMSIGPVTWVVIAEIFPTRTRAQAMGLATLCLWFADYVVTQTFPMMNENKWLVETFNRGFPFLLYGSLCIVEILFIWRFVPETKGKSLEEIEHMWLARAGKGNVTQN